jgi:hypothetical protein
MFLRDIAAHFLEVGGAARGEMQIAPFVRELESDGAAYAARRAGYQRGAAG